MAKASAPEINLTPDIDPRDMEIAHLKHQISSLEDFANAVVEQRNIAYNEIAQYKVQIIRQSKSMESAQ